MKIVIDTNRIASSLWHSIGAMRQALKKLRHPVKSYRQWRLDRDWQAEAEAHYYARRFRGEP